MRRLPTIGDGPPLVYVPGLDGSGEMLFAHEDEIARRFRLVRVPSRTDSAFGYDDLVGDVVAAMDDENVERATVFAESFGGSVALRLALEHPERVERLVMLNTFAWFPNRPLLKWGGALARNAPAAVVHAVRILVDTPTLAIEGVPAEARARFLEITKRQPLAGYGRRLELLEELDLRDRIAELRVPAYFVAAEFDRVVPPDCSRFMAGRAPHGSLRILPGVGHASLLTPGISLAELLHESHERARNVDYCSSS